MLTQRGPHQERGGADNQRVLLGAYLEAMSPHSAATRRW